MLHGRRAYLAGAVLILTLLAFPATAQEWGIANTEYYALPAFAFTGWDQTYNDQILGFGQARYCTGLCLLAAPVVLRTGTSVTAIEIDGFDSDPGGRIECGFMTCGFQEDGCTTVGIAGTDNAYDSGDAAFETVFASPVTIDNGEMTYEFYCFLAGGTSATRLRAVRVRYQFVISPAPAEATFDDVPVGAFGFQHVEALAASGITAGCSASSFCPNQPLTRVQMAVFLAKALGLHWADTTWPPY